MSAPSTGPERIVAGFRLGKELGEGGQGRVYRASPTQGGPDVAIKLYELPIEPKQQEKARKRHQREVQALKGVTSTSIVTIVEHGEHSAPTLSSAGSLWIAFEFIEGRHLRHMMGLSPAEAARVLSMFRALAAGLDLVHSKRVVHRDIKPENVILRGKKWDDPVLVDFGYAREVTASRNTRTGFVPGTRGYTAPELDRDSAKADALSDQWSFARVSAELLLWAIGERHDDISEGSDAVEDVADRFSQWDATAHVFEGALDSDPGARFDDVSSFVNALEEALYDDNLLKREADTAGFDGKHWDKRRPLKNYIEEMGFKVIVDHRAGGGALWVKANEEFEPIAEYLESRGVVFKEGSGRASGHRPAWYTKGDG